MAKHDTDPGLLGKDYAKEVDAESAHHLHVRAGGKDEGLWRISLESVDGWTVSASHDAAADEGPFARLLSRETPQHQGGTRGH